MTEYDIRIEDMAVGYDGKPLLEGMDITLKQGEILTLIGPNGAGKSTILRTIARQLDLLGGTVFIGRKELRQFTGSELARIMAIVLTDRLRTEMMTCEEVVATGRYPYTGLFGILTSKDKAIVRASMERVHAQDLYGQDFRKISDGQRQRVMLARALCQEPEVIILDEPTSHLDLKYKLEFLTILREMSREENLTVIMSLHELELAERIADKVLCVNGIGTERFGSPEEIFCPEYIAGLYGISLPLSEAENDENRKQISCSEQIINEVTAQWRK